MRLVGESGGRRYVARRGSTRLFKTCAASAYLHAGSGNALAQGLALGALFILASLPCCFVWPAFGATAQRFLHSDPARRTFNIAMGALLAGSVVLVVR
jgi:threonine/homoserine/homoserine lactone efflux protein